MKIPQLSFSWKPTISGREKWRLGLWILVDGKHGRRSKLRIMVRGVLLWLAALAAMAYLGLVSAWFFVLDRRPHNLVTWSDCVLAPVRWDEIRRKRGDSYISEGLAAMEARNWSEAIVRIQAGLSRSPDNRNGRERLGMFFVAAGQADRGLKLLLAGIERGYPGREPMERFIRVTMMRENFPMALLAVEAVLAQNGSAVDRDRRWLIDQYCRLLMAAGRQEEVVEWTANQSQMSELLHESRVIALIELDRFEEAHEALELWEAGSGALGGGERVRVRLAREEVDLVAMRDALEAMRSRHPMRPSPMVYSIVQEFLIGEEQVASDQLQGYFIRFGAKLTNFRLLMAPLVEIQAWELFDAAVNRAKEMGFDDASLTRFRVEAAIARKNYTEALMLLDSYDDIEPQGLAPDQPRVDLWVGLQRQLASHLHTGEEASGGALVEQIRTTRFALSAIRDVAKKLEEGGRLDTSLQVWQVARGRFPNSAVVLQATERIGQLVGASEVAPIPEIPMVADGAPLAIEPEEFLTPSSSENRPELVSAKRFFDLCDQLIAASDWSALGELIRDLRRARPVWYASRQNDLLVREMALNTGEKNWPALISNVRARLDGSLGRGLEAMNVVRELDGAGERAAAEQILREVERRHQDFPPARRQREDWAAEAERLEKEAAADADEPTQ